MITKRRGALVAAVAVAVGVGATVGAWASSGTVNEPFVEVDSGGAVDTPTGTFLGLSSQSFTTVGAGPVVVRVAVYGYERDLNSGGVFVGKNYAAMQFRVLLDGTTLSPGATTMLDNTGKIGVGAARPTAGMFQWSRTVPAGPHTVAVQWRNLHTWDEATLKRWTVVVQHA